MSAGSHWGWSPRPVRRWPRGHTTELRTVLPTSPPVSTHLTYLTHLTHLTNITHLTHPTNLMHLTHLTHPTILTHLTLSLTPSLLSDDDSRVVLEEIPGEKGSDYINASWIDVTNTKHTHLHTLTHLHIFIHPHTLTHLHTPTHTYTHSLTHTHTHTQCNRFFLTFRVITTKGPILLLKVQIFTLPFFPPFLSPSLPLPLSHSLSLSLPPSLSLSLSVLGPTHTGGRPATCAYWVDNTQAHVVQ